MLLECEQKTRVIWFYVHTETFAVAYCWLEFNTKKATLVKIDDPNGTMQKADYHEGLHYLLRHKPNNKVHRKIGISGRIM